MNLLDQIRQNPQEITFSEVIAHIDAHYEFRPTRFTNGDTVNEAGQNNGSCKLLFFAQQQGLDAETTLQLFGDYYRTDVLKNLEGNDHQNIRNFMRYGWSGVAFDGTPLQIKPSQ
ncbi:MAG: HopJ type III effector protein [Lunatimonas sp.]|uniref:HopJ type III effector protein n=1 Tax=Lunatimonas sp. TaxID=2060141 RepID=UPI00263B6FB6|nr:HopJ type III effector protein [Lunatimonas sp.]MCC5936050.1 HopJ type III effector protein [Lunatimonas sp.]